MVLMHKKMTSTVYKQYGTTKGYCCKFVISCFQIKQEITGCLDFMTYVYSQFGFSFKLQLSTRPEQFLGEIAVWDEAEKVSRVPMPTTALSLYCARLTTLSRFCVSFPLFTCCTMFLFSLGSNWRRVWTSLAASGSSIRLTAPSTDPRFGGGAAAILATMTFTNYVLNSSLFVT